MPALIQARDNPVIRDGKRRTNTFLQQVHLLKACFDADFSPLLISSRSISANMREAQHQMRRERGSRGGWQQMGEKVRPKTSLSSRWNYWRNVFGMCSVSTLDGRLKPFFFVHQRKIRKKAIATAFELEIFHTVKFAESDEYIKHITWSFPATRYISYTGRK